MGGAAREALIDLFATIVLLVFLAAFAWMLVYKVDSGFRSGEATFDVRIPIWPFHALAALGIFLATVLIAIRLVRIWRGTGAAEPRRSIPSNRARDDPGSRSRSSDLSRCSC